MGQLPCATPAPCPCPPRATTNKTGLKVRCELDTRAYAKGIKVSDDEMASLNITGDRFHPEWNYSISPRRLL